MSYVEFPKKAKDVITSPLPAAIIKQREGGGKKMLSYISGQTVIDMLNNAFGYLWDWEIEKEWIEQSTKSFNAYSKLPKDQQITHNGKQGAWEDQGPVCHVRGRLTVFINVVDGVMKRISKSGYGSKSVLGKQNDQESIFKAAGTDALKKAASLFGFGLSLYRDEEEQGYFDELNYDDPWTEEMLTKHSDDRDYLTQVMKQYELGAEDMDGIVQEFSESALSGLGDIVPENIESFVAYMKNRISATAGTETEGA